MSNEPRIDRITIVYSSAKEVRRREFGGIRQCKDGTLLVCRYECGSYKWLEWVPVADYDVSRSGIALPRGTRLMRAGFHGPVRKGFVVPEALQRYPRLSPS